MSQILGKNGGWTAVASSRWVLFVYLQANLPSRREHMSCGLTKRETRNSSSSRPFYSFISRLSSLLSFTFLSNTPANQDIFSATRPNQLAEIAKNRSASVKVTILSSSNNQVPHPSSQHQALALRKAISLRPSTHTAFNLTLSKATVLKPT